MKRKKDKERETDDTAQEEETPIWKQNNDKLKRFDNSNCKYNYIGMPIIYTYVVQF